MEVQRYIRYDGELYAVVEPFRVFRVEPGMELGAEITDSELAMKIIDTGIRVVARTIWCPAP